MLRVRRPVYVPLMPDPKYLPPPLDFAPELCYIKMILKGGGIMSELNEDVDDWIFGSEDQSNQVSSR